MTDREVLFFRVAFYFRVKSQEIALGMRAEDRIAKRILETQKLNQQEKVQVWDDFLAVCNLLGLTGVEKTILCCYFFVSEWDENEID